MDKSVWGGIRKKYNKQEDEKSAKSENDTENKKENIQEEQSDKQEQPGFLARIKKAIFG